IPRWVSRSMKISETMPSSRSATFVSWGVLLTIRSLVMEGPFHEPSLAPAGLVAGGMVEERLWRRNGELGGARSAATSECEAGVTRQKKSGIRRGMAYQLAKRRMRTLRMRPTAKREESTEE